jgi:hypothetical protein
MLQNPYILNTVVVIIKLETKCTCEQGRNIQPGNTPLSTAAGPEVSAVRDQLFVRLRSADHEAYVTRFDTQARNGVIHAIDTVL